MLRSFAVASALLALPAVFSVTAAQAQDVSAWVSFADLNLSRPADAKVMADRLEGAAKDVCTRANPENIRPAVMESCVDASMTDALAQIEDGLDQGIQDKMVNIRSATKDL